MSQLLIREQGTDSRRGGDRAQAMGVREEGCCQGRCPCSSQAEPTAQGQGRKSFKLPLQTEFPLYIPINIRT